MHLLTRRPLNFQVCPEGLHIATGNRYGRVMVFDAHSMKLVATRYAHDTEVTALSYAATHLHKVELGPRPRVRILSNEDSMYDLISDITKTIN